MDNRLRICLDPLEKKKLRKIAKDRRMNISEMIRKDYQLSEEKPINDKLTKDDEEVLAAFKMNPYQPLSKAALTKYYDIKLKRFRFDKAIERLIERNLVKEVKIRSTSNPKAIRFEPEDYDGARLPWFTRKSKFYMLVKPESDDTYLQNI